MKHEFLSYLEENFYVEFDRDDEYVLDENGNVSELYLWEHNQTYGIAGDPRYISDISVLLPLCASLKVLHINNWTVEDMSPLKYFVHLRELSLSHNNKIKRISGIENLTDLEFLDISGNEIKKIEGLEKLVKLKLLDVRGNYHIKKIEGLETLSHLTALYLHDCDIKKVEGIDHLVHLKRLTLHHNKIKTLENMPSLSGLTRLTIGNKLEEFPDLRNYPLLEELGIRGNGITIPDLNFLEHLHTVEIGGDNIQNQEVLMKHKNLKNIEVDCNHLKGTLSPTFWTSDR